MPNPKAKKVPDAWDDDDWEAQADRTAKEPPKEEAPAAPLSKTDRIELHREHNRKLWESADSPEPFHFLEVTNPAPAATTNLRPQVKLLSRKPTPARDPTTNMAGLSLRDDEEDEEEARRRHQVEAEARMREGERMLAEKQKAYDEARRRIFGEEKVDDGKSAGKGSGRGRGNRGARGRGRGRGNDGRGSDTSRSATSSRSATPAGARREHHGASSPKPSILQKSESTPGRRRDDGQAPAVREPRGPDGSGRGGFGFARRGAK